MSAQGDQKPPGRRALTPIGDEHEFGVETPEIGRPSPFDRLRRGLARVRPRNRAGRFAFDVLGLAVILVALAGFAYAIGLFFTHLFGLTHRDAELIAFVMVGAGAVLVSPVFGVSAW